MTRICGVCKMPPREGQAMRPMRLKEVDMEEVTTVNDVGLYMACLDCVESHRKRMAAREGKQPSEISNGMLC